MANTVTGVTELCRKVGVHQGFRRFEWNPNIEHMLHSYPRDGERGWGRFVENGFYGNILAEPPAGEPWSVFEDWHAMIALLGALIFCGDHMSRM